MRAFPLVIVSMLLALSPVASADADCVVVANGTQVCDAEAGYGTEGECEDNTDSFNTYMRLHAIWIELDSERSVHASTYEGCTRADRIGVDREYYSAGAWYEEGGEETTLVDLRYQRDHAAQTCTLVVVDAETSLDPRACAMRGGHLPTPLP